MLTRSGKEAVCLGVTNRVRTDSRTRLSMESSPKNFLKQTPLLIIFFSRSYIFSIMLCVFYSVFNLLSTFSMTALPKWLVLTLPTPSIMLWGTQQMSSRTAINDTEDLQNFIQMGLIPSTPQLIITLGVIGVVSLLLAVYLYKKRSE